MKCAFLFAYSYTPCGAETANANGICDNHDKCCSCGKPATHECSYAGQFVCGYPLCGDCHGFNVETSDRGLGWGFMGHRHGPKDAKADEVKR